MKKEINFSDVVTEEQKRKMFEKDFESTYWIVRDLKDKFDKTEGKYSVPYLNGAYQMWECGFYYGVTSHVFYQLELENGKWKKIKNIIQSAKRLLSKLSGTT